MDTLLTTNNLIAFAVGLLIGVVVGALVGLYLGLHLKNHDNPVVFSNVFGIFMALLWAGSHTFAIITGDIAIPFIFDLVGGLAMGQTLGLDLVEVLKKVKK